MGNKNNLNADILIKDLFTELLRRDTEMRFEARGWSMHPFIRDGDLITIEPIGYEQAEIGDILAYQNLKSKKITVHRLVKKNNDGQQPILITKGDANTKLIHDLPMCSCDYILAKVVTIERGGKIIKLKGKSYRLSAYLRAVLLLYCPWVIFVQRKCISALIKGYKQYTKNGLGYRDI